MSATLTGAVELLAELGMPVRVDGPAQVSIVSDDAARRMRLVQRAPTPSARAAARRAAPADEVSAFVVARANDAALAAALADPLLAIIAVDDGVVVVGGTRYARAETATAEPSPHRRVPWGRFALMRTLARTETPRPQRQLAAESGVTQAAVSQELHRMSSSVRRTAGGWHSTDRWALWRSFLAEYPGPRGIVVHWYSVQPVIAQSGAAAGVVSGALLSGDAAADVIAPWRIPRRAVVYGTAGADLSRLSFAESSATEATLDLVVPADPTIIATARAWDPGGAVVDPLIAAWDVLRSGGSDAAEAAARLEVVALSRGET